MTRIASALFASILLALPISAASLGELFQKAKTEVKASNWSEALKTLDALDAASRAPEAEAQRKQIEPALAFYRGVCLANLDKSEESQAQFEAYLAGSPNASMDRGMYSKKAVDAFEMARKKGAAQGEPASGMPSLANSYKEFRVTGQASEPPNESWAEGPARALLTSEEKRDWAALSDPLARSEFVTKFWGTRDPKPETPDNEFRQEFEKRVAFADKYFAQDEVRGSLTDRGMVFILMGPPTWAGRKPLETGDDVADAQGLSTTGRHDAEIAAANARSGSSSGRLSTSTMNTIADQSQGPGKSALEAGHNWREIWHYRKELLPAGVPYQQVDFEFVTKRGYGKNILQRLPPVLTTIDIARQRMRSAGRAS
jgi:GWxTD domain-containing protein